MPRCRSRSWRRPPNAPPAAGQTYDGLPTFGLQRGAACNTLGLRDVSPGGSMVPVGCVETSTHAFVSTPNAIITGPGTFNGLLMLPDVTIPVLRFNVTGDAREPQNFAFISPGGARVSMASIAGHDTYGKYGADSFRTQFALRATSQADGGVEETTAIIEHRGVTGYTPPYKRSHAYPAGKQVSGPDGHIFETSKACTSGTGSGPVAADSSNPPGPQADNSCSWRYVGIGAGNNKTPLIMNGSIEPPRNGLAGGGQGWTQANIMDVQTGAWPEGGGFAVGIEQDMGNNVRDCPPATPEACQMYGIFLNGNGLFKSTVGLYIGGTQGFHVGLLLDGSSSSDVAMQNSSNAQTGYNDNGNHVIASIRDMATTPVATSYEGTYSVAAARSSGASSIGFYAHTEAHTTAGFYDDLSANGFRTGGFHSGAAFLDQSITPFGLRLLGTYGVAQVAGTGWSVDPSGMISANGFSAPSLAASGGTVRGTVCVDTAGKFYVKTTTGACL